MFSNKENLKVDILPVEPTSCLNTCSHGSRSVSELTADAGGVGAHGRDLRREVVVVGERAAGRLARVPHGDCHRHRACSALRSKVTHTHTHVMRRSRSSSYKSNLSLVTHRWRPAAQLDVRGGDHGALAPPHADRGVEAEAEAAEREQRPT